MSRKHFQALADALRYTRPYDSWPADEADSRRVQWNKTVQAVALVCGSSNELFDEGRFLEACGGLYDFSVRPSIAIVKEAA